MDHAVFILEEIHKKNGILVCDACKAHGPYMRSPVTMHSLSGHNHRLLVALDLLVTALKVRLNICLVVIFGHYVIVITDSQKCIDITLNNV